MTTTEPLGMLHEPPPPLSPRSGVGVGHIIMLILGSVLSLVGLALAGVAAVLGAAVFGQRADGMVSTPAELYAVNSYAITSEQLEILVDPGLPRGLRVGDLGTVVLRAQSGTVGKDVFVGVARQADVSRYLRDVAHSQLMSVRFSPFDATYRDITGSAAPRPPAGETFWVTSAQGPGVQQIEAQLQSGTWAVVVMNADASRPVAATLQSGFRSPLLKPASVGSLITGLVLLVVGIPLVVLGAVGLGRRTAPPQLPGGPTSGGTAPPYEGPAPARSAPAGATTLSRMQARAYPARLYGDLTDPPSRWMWLVKWFLAIPHYIVLSILWFAFVVTTLAAGVAILFTGRYPRPLFAFNVGVLRWTWRVGFYAFAALGTDRYPPFTLARTDYPADFDVEYPEHLSRGLVLVKSWLLAIPHLLVIALLTGNVWSWWTTRDDWPVDVNEPAGISLTGLLVLVAAVVLLFTGRYPRSLFDLIVGIHRWIYRVAAYVGLMRDEYPPFRLDLGPDEPGSPEIEPTTVVETPSSGDATVQAKP